MTPLEQDLITYVGSIKCNLFSDRPNMREALEYANMVARASENPPATITAVYVAINTFCNVILEIIETRRS